MKGFYIYFTNDVSQGTHLLILFVAKPNVYHYQKCHDSIIIRHSQSWAEVLYVNIQAPNMISLELASQTTFTNSIANSFPAKASFLLVFLRSIEGNEWRDIT